MNSLIPAATTYFSLLPGGLVEMAHIGVKLGAKPSVIASLHAMRVAILVFLIPLGLFLYSEQIAVEQLPPLTLNTTSLVLVLFIGALGGIGFQFLGLPAPFLLGPLVSVAVFSFFTSPEGTTPETLLTIAQLVLGFSLGAKFRRADIKLIPRAMLCASLFVPVFILLMAVLAVFAKRFIDQSLGTLVLAFSIGGMAEMVITAQNLGQNAALVAAFQIVRAVVVNFFAGFLWKSLSRFSYFSKS